MALCQQFHSLDDPPRPPGNGSAPLKRALLAGLIWILSAPAGFGQGGAPKRDETPGTLQSGLGDELPGWLSLSGEFRFRFENGQGLGYSEDSDDGYGLTRTRLELGVGGPWLNFRIEAQDSRPRGSGGAVQLEPSGIRSTCARPMPRSAPAGLRHR